MGCLTVLLLSCGGSGDSNEGSTISSNDNSSSRWTIDTDFIQDGGPGKDGIPSLDQPSFQSIEETNFMFASDLIVALKIGDQVKGYPHKILNWHEVVNDSIADEHFVLSYCPLTGSAMAWNIDNQTGNTEFGVSGLLYNSNLILYDRATDSHWPQMLMKSANGALSGNSATPKPIVETTWEKFKMMFPQAEVLSEDTGFSRNYDEYPYGNYLTNPRLLFVVKNVEDERLHKKARILGIRVGSATKAYNISEFSIDLEVINDSVSSKKVVIVGSQDDKYAVAFERQLSDGTVLEFSPEYNQLPIVMADNEGNLWDIYGKAVTGPREGEQLVVPFSYISFWFAWAAFFTDAPIYQ